MSDVKVVELKDGTALVVARDAAAADVDRALETLGDAVSRCVVRITTLGADGEPVDVTAD